MRAAARDPEPQAKDWADALLTSGTESLLGAVRNYLGPVKTPYDKRELVRRLGAFVKRPETRAAMLELLDALDARILGTCLLIGPASEQDIKDLFLGELPLFELGLRMSNLLDRLLLFRFASGNKRLVAVNPLLAEDLRARVMDPGLLLGAAPAADSGSCDAAAIVGLYSFLFHAPASLRKGGGLTKRAAEKADALFRGMGRGWIESGPERLDAMSRALARSGALRVEEESWTADGAVFARLARDWGEDLPCLLAALLASCEPRTEAGDGARESATDREAPPPGAAGGAAAIERAAPLARLIGRALRAIPEGFCLPRAGFARWLRLAAFASPRAAGAGRGRFDALGDPAIAAPALEALGVAPARPGRPRPAVPAAGDEDLSPALVAEGAHALHLMPEAGLEDRLLVGAIARPVAFGKVWSFELDRETARSGFAAGVGADSALARLERMAQRPLPQSLGFSLRAWEEEYRSLRLYRGLVLVADERHRPLVEAGIASGSLDAESLSPGVYFLGARSPDEAAAQLGRCGLDSPSGLSSGAPRAGPAAHGGSAPVGAKDGPGSGGEGGGSDGAPDDALAELASAFAGAGNGGRILDPSPRLELMRGILADSARSPQEVKEIGDRIERRLVLTAEQIALSDPRAERMEAGGLDYLGKVRVVERALRSPGDRLELLYRLPGAEPARAILRPVRLEKNERGLILEAEDLGTGGPIRVPLGAVSTVRRMRASLFGEEA